MRPDEQVRHDPDARGAALAAKLAPELSGFRRRVIENRLESDAEKLHRFGKLRVSLEMSANFGPDDLASNESSGVIRIAQGLARSLAMDRVSAQNIQKDR